MSLLDALFGFLFRSGRGGTPADQKPHDQRGDETVDPSGIAIVDGQIQDNTEIDPEIQDKKKGFPGGTNP